MTLRIHRVELTRDRAWQEIAVPTNSEIFWVRDEDGQLASYWWVPADGEDTTEPWLVRSDALPVPRSPMFPLVYGECDRPDAQPFMGEEFVWVCKQTPPAENLE